MSDKVIILSVDELTFLDVLLKHHIDQLHSKLFFSAKQIESANKVISVCDSIIFKITEVLNG